MNVTCSDRDRIFEDGQLAEWAALEAHAASCTLCAEELRAWKWLCVAANELRDYSASPSLWPRIERALAEEAARNARHAERKRWFSFLPSFSPVWQTALAGAFVLLLTISAGWLFIHHPAPIVDDNNSLLKSGALKEVESAESVYERAIDKLAVQAQPQLDVRPSPEPLTTVLKKGMSLAEVEQALGKADKTTEKAEGSLKIVTATFTRGDQVISADFIEGILVKYSISSR